MARQIDRSPLANQIRAAIGSDPKILFALGFGSRWRGIPTSTSDLDIGLYIAGSYSFDQLADWMLQVEAVTGVEPVDFVVLNKANPIVRYEALKGELLWCHDWEAYASFFSLSCRHYEETEWHRERYRKWQQQQEPTLGT